MTRVSTVHPSLRLWLTRFICLKGRTRVQITSLPFGENVAVATSPWVHAEIMTQPKVGFDLKASIFLGNLRTEATFGRDSLGLFSRSFMFHRETFAWRTGTD